MKLGGDALLVVLLLAFAASGSHDTPSPSPTPSPSGGGVPMKATFEPTSIPGAPSAQSQWVMTRYDCALELLQDQLPPQYDAEEVARSVVAHWAIETQWGTHEYNFNLGGIHASPGQAYFNSTDAGRPTRFASYGSLEDGAKAYAGMLMGKFKQCALQLMDAPDAPGWYVCLGTKGYYAANPNAASLITSARSTVASILKAQGIA